MCTLDDETIPDHSFETKIIKGKIDAMKGKTRETVSLLIGNHIFRKKNILPTSRSLPEQVRFCRMQHLRSLHHSGRRPSSSTPV